jgi:hypothetical protein
MHEWMLVVSGVRPGGVWITVYLETGEGEGERERERERERKRVRVGGG